ncbi:MAG TPA: hypothetical protein ENK59_06790 [Thioploca sp.]|nr:hypothetical protein [Thioploca sp.]
MLSFQEKLTILKSILLQEEYSYADSFNAEILIFSENLDFIFMNKLNSKTDIENWIRNLKSRIVMREEQDLIQNIIEDYILYG